MSNFDFVIGNDGYYRGYKQGREDGYSQAETDYFKQTEKDRQSAFECGYEKGREDVIEELVDALCCHSAFNMLQKDIIITYAEQLKEKKE